MTPTIECMRRHRSIRRFSERAVPDDVVREAVQAGQSASTSSAVQAYSVLQITTPGSRERLAALTGPQEKVAKCGGFFVMCGDVRRHRLLAERAGRSYQARLEAFLVAVIDATLFAQNFCLAFESRGYGICYIGGLRNQLAEVDALLDLPDGVYPLYGICVGEPAEDPRPRPRLDPDAVLFRDVYPDDETLMAQVDAYDDRYRDYVRTRGASDAPTWSARIAEHAGASVRIDLASYYLGKGARLD